MRVLSSGLTEHEFDEIPNPREANTEYEADDGKQGTEKDASDGAAIRPQHPPPRPVAARPFRPRTESVPAGFDGCAPGHARPIAKSWR